MLRILYPDSEITSHPVNRTLGVGSFIVAIAPDCSGYEGIGLIAVFLLAFVWLFRKSLRFPQALLLFPIGMIGAWLANAVRITALIALGASWSRSMALGGFHSQAGWLAFTAIALALVACSLRFPFFSRIDAKAADSYRANSTPAYLVTFLVVIGVNMVAAAFEADPQFDSLYPLKVLAAIVVLACFHRTYRQIEWSWSWPAVVCGVVVFAVWIALDIVGGAPRLATPPDGLAELAPGWAATWIVFRVLGSVFTIPLAEELAFRGYLMRRMNAADFSRQPFETCSWMSVFISSALFGLMHGRWFAGTLAGLMYALIARRRGKLCDAVFAHAVTNALIAAAVLLEGAWWLWS
jgi:exosortase E/protease (VPEID-CTERM system)